MEAAGAAAVAWVAAEAALPRAWQAPSMNRDRPGAVVLPLAAVAADAPEEEEEVREASKEMGPGSIEAEALHPRPGPSAR